MNAGRSYRNDPTQALSLSQAAKHLGISKAHLANVIRGRVGCVPALRHAKVGRRILIRRVWLDEWLEKVGERSVLSSVSI
jgi:excisionase family DNA binding protein